MSTEPADTDLIDPDVADVDTGPADVPPIRPVRSRMLPALIVSALLGAAAGGAVVYLGLMKPPSPPGAPGVSRNAPPAAPAPAARGKGTVAGSEWASALTNAKRDIAAGRFREAQEEYLSILLIEPAHEEAMRGLVRVVGLIAKGDRAVLRRQAEEYRRAIALGTETEEHYTAPAMEILARASLQAAGIRATPVGAQAPPTSSPESGGTRPQAASRPAPNPPSPPPARRTQPAPTTPAPRPQTPAAPAPSAPPPTTTSPAPSAAQPVSPPSAPLNVNEPFVTVVIGPFGSSERASAVTGELTISGYAARVRRQGEGSYLITLGPYRKSEAERAAAFVKSRFGANVPVALSPTP